MNAPETTDVLIIGGGFYGCCLALLLADRHTKVTILERAPDLMTRASALNQARVHAGFHYPRNFLTACRSLINFPRFTLEFRKAIVDDFTKLYAVARHGSKVTARRFFRMYTDMKAQIRPAAPRYAALFDPDFIEALFEVREYAFDCDILRELLRDRLNSAGVRVLYGYDVRAVIANKPEGSGLVCLDEAGAAYAAPAVFNCTYTRLNHLLRASGLPLLALKHELTEICLVEVPEALHGLGVTIMDGPFFSVMPYPSAGLHSLTHVRYTPHQKWLDGERDADPYSLADSPPPSNFIHMRNDALRYLPALRGVRHVRSLFEITTVLLRNEDDEGRPILFRTDYGLPGLSVVLGSKIDNIYDVLAMVKEMRQAARPAG